MSALRVCASEALMYTARRLKIAGAPMCLVMYLSHAAIRVL